MRKIGVAVDANGFYVMDILEGMTVDEGLTLVTVPCPDGLYNPKFDFETQSWNHGLTQEEIDALTNTPPSFSEIDILGQRIVDLEIRLMLGGL